MGMNGSRERRLFNFGLLISLGPEYKEESVTLPMSNSAPTSITVKHRAKDGNVSEISCSENVHSYNCFIGGVDLADQLRGYYHVRMKSRKFYKFCLWVFGSSLEAHYKVSVLCRYIFWFRFDCCTVNAFILQSFRFLPGLGADWRLQLPSEVLTSRTNLWCGRPPVHSTCKTEEDEWHQHHN